MNLDFILKSVKKRLDIKKKEYSYDWLGRSLAFNNYPPRNIIEILNDKEVSTIGVIDIRFCKDAFLEFSQQYEQKGVKLLSINTQEEFFNGDVEFLGAIRRYVSLLLIRDDFIIDEYQVLESIVYGADSIILKANILKRKKLKELIDFSRRLGMEAIVEINSKEELVKAIFAGSEILNINCEDWKGDMEDEGRFKKLINLIPKGKIITIKNAFSPQKIFQNEDFKGVSGYFLKEIS